MSLNSIIPTIKDSMFYYAYYKDYYDTKDSINNEEIEYLKEIFDKSKFIYSDKRKYLVINPRTIGDEIIRVYGYKEDTVKNLFKLYNDLPANVNYEPKWKIENSYIIVHGDYHNGLSRVSDFYSYDYIYGIKKDSLVILDSIISRHRENKFKDIGDKTILVGSYATAINWKFISKDCILKEIQSGEVNPLPRTDTIIFKPNSKKSIEKKCFN
ncbi:hypothetical protein [[Flexibacter] sp. ATCC 35103]|uniref:hypothetical protein n=1 Tax=[Flexibacter] sp. ATCC 35103 TaxID=1937528 RepID=UPI000F509C8A|nr:hypothetical protein [[Flexibacter] sp. ATCC 35103]